MCVHLNTVLDEFKGNFDLTPFWVKNLEKISDFTVDATFQNQNQNQVYFKKNEEHSGYNNKQQNK